jgi:hypothetical protein
MNSHHIMSSSMYGQKKAYHQTHPSGYAKLATSHGDHYICHEVATAISLKAAFLLSFWQMANFRWSV